MFLREALGVDSSAEVDPGRPIVVGGLELGPDAAAESVRILDGGEFSQAIDINAKSIESPNYWAVSHKTEGQAELFGFPAGAAGGFPTALEVALIRALAASAPGLHPAILAGGVEIGLGPILARQTFQRIISCVSKPLSGNSIFFGSASQAIIGHDADSKISSISLKCLESSFRTAPIKFRFIELYRIIENRFLEEVKLRLLDRFNAEPADAVSEALEALKSEMTQIVGLAQTQQPAFEACWNAIDTVRNTNQFAAALFRRIKKRKLEGQKWQTGAALIYQIRCAIVHAGEKDMIFENFPDGDALIESVITLIEDAALRLLHVELV